MEPAWIKSNQIEAARIAMTRYIKRGGQVWIKIFPDKPVTTKPAETRMGSGKGSLEYWVVIADYLPYAGLTKISFFHGKILLSARSAQACLLCAESTV